MAAKQRANTIGEDDILDCRPYANRLETDCR
jgi:hypothetical protein